MAKSRAEWRRVALETMNWVIGFEQMVAAMQQWVDTNSERIARLSNLQEAARDEEADELYNPGADEDDQEGAS